MQLQHLSHMTVMLEMSANAMVNEKCQRRDESCSRYQWGKLGVRVQFPFEFNDRAAQRAHLEEFMANKLSHFAIHADDVERAKQFYGKIFEWDFTGYGPPDFWQIMARGGEAVPMGAIQSRRYNVIEQKLFGFECSFAVSDVEQAVRAVE